MFLSALTALRTDPASRTYYERKRAQGKRHNQAVLALAHRRLTHHIGAPPTWMDRDELEKVDTTVGVLLG